jgi:hypothetical protein
MAPVISSKAKNHISQDQNIHLQSCEGFQSRPAPSSRNLRYYLATVLDTADNHSSYASNKRNFDTEQPFQSLGFNGIMVGINNEYAELNVMVAGRGIETTDSGLPNPHRQLNSCFKSHCVAH